MNHRAISRCLLVCGLAVAPASISAAVSAPPTSNYIEHLTRGAQREAAGDLEAAHGIYQALYAEYPDRIDVFLRLESVTSRLGRYTEALELLDRWLARRPNDTTIRMRRGAALFALGRSEEAFAEWEGLLEGARNPGLYNTVAENYVRRNLDARAAEVYRRGRVALRQPDLFVRELAEIAERRGDKLEAVREYLALVEQRPQYMPLVESRLREMARSPEGNDTLAAFLATRARSTPDARTLRLFVTFAEESGHGRTAYDVLAGLDDGAEGSLARLGDHALGSGDHALAADAYTALLARTKNAALRATGLLGLARAEQGRGNTDDAATHYQRIVTELGRYPVAEEAAYRLAGLRAALGDTAGATGVYRVLAGNGGRSPWRYSALFDLADLYIVAGDDSLALAAYATIRREQVGRDRAPEAALRTARLLYFDRKFDEARATLDTLMTGTLLAGAVNDALDLSVLLETGLSEDRRVLEHMAAADRLRQTGRLEAAADTLEAAYRASPNSPLADRVLRGRIEILSELRRYEPAARLCATLLETESDGPLGPWAGLTLGDLLSEELGRPEEAAAIYERILIDFPESVEADTARDRLRALRRKESPPPTRETG